MLAGVLDVVIVTLLMQEVLGEGVQEYVVGVKPIPFVKTPPVLMVMLSMVTSSLVEPPVWVMVTLVGPDPVVGRGRLVADML